jgi:hypothetical protein
VLVVNTSLQEAILEQGDPVASLVSAPEGPVHPLHFHEGTSSKPPPQQIAHIVEDTEAFERMLEEEIPPDDYYDLLREDLARRHPQACRHVLDHLLELEALLDVATVTGFSLGVNKLKLLQTKAELLGDFVDRDGREPSPERMKAIQEFPPLMELKHLHGFLGCTNRVRGYLPQQYGALVKILGAWLEPGAKFPLDEKGLQAVKAIKKMVKDHISLAVMDEEAAVDGTRPLEQVADASGIAWRGSACWRCVPEDLLQPNRAGPP